MRKIKIIFTILLMFIGIKNICAVDNTLKVYDYAQVLNSEEEANLKESVLNYINKYNMDMILVTVKHHEKSNTKEYAQDFYDYNEFGISSTKDGIIFVIDFTFGYTDIYIATTGEAIRMYDDYRINKMLDNIADKKNSGEYAMFDRFIKDSENYAKLGIPSSNSNTIINNNGDLIYKVSMPWFLIIIISAIVPTIVVAILINKNKMIKKSINATYYLKEGSKIINNRSDRFITTHTTSIRINDDVSSGGGRVGRSSTSRGSSGISHGGGGRRL